MVAIILGYNTPISPIFTMRHVPHIILKSTNDVLSTHDMNKTLLDSEQQNNQIDDNCASLSTKVI